MSAHRLRVKQVFEAASALRDEARAAFLAGAVPDPALRAEVESLLAAHDQAEGFLETPVVAEGLRVLQGVDEGDLLGRRIGPYRVIGEIGHGGMGAVYAAVRADDQYEKKVAIKVVKRGMDTDFILQRFRGERQILAGLDHPNIARLLDGGTTEDGLPYFVMEHIEGQPIHLWCESRELPIAARLQLFRAVCSAVHYAHQNLIVHRDIKPTNILVTGQGVPKLLDFGIAKLLNPAGFPETVVPTALGQRLMTPDYASPEQVKGEAITTATDVYALGVLLYELLTARRPYRLRSLEPEELLRVICEEEPLPPSEAVRHPAVEESLGAPTAAAASTATLTLEPLRTTDVRPARWSRELAGDLDTIVLMALRKEPRRRYASVDQFSEDIRRYLEGLPVVARKDTLFYRTGKFVRRHRVVVVAAAVSFLALSAGLAGTLWQAREARLERARAERRFNDVRKLASSFLFEFHDAIENLPGSTKARELVVKRALEYLDSLSQEADDPGLRRELAEAYRRVGDVQGNPYFANLGDTKGALASYRKALALDARTALDAPSTDVKLELSTDHNRIGDLLLQMGDTTGSLESHRAALAVAVALPPESAAVLRRLYVAYTKVGEALSRGGGGRNARRMFDLALLAAQKQAAADPAQARAQRDLSVAYVNVGDAMSDAGDKAGALAAFDKALAIRERTLAADLQNTRARYDVAAVLERKGSVQAALGDLAGALATQQRGLDVISAVAAADAANVGARRGMAISESSIGRLLVSAQRAPEAVERFSRARELRRRMAADDPTNANLRTELAESEADVGETLLALGRRGEACRALSASRALYAELARAGQLPADHEAEPARVAQLAAGCP